jgi:signal transduction histidine kinase
VVVAFTFAIGSLSLVGTFLRHSVIAGLLVIVLVQAIALLWRRTHPIPVLLAVVGAAIVTGFINPDREPSAPALVFAVYAASMYGPSRARLWVVVAAILLVVGAVALLLLNDFNTARNLLPAGATSLVAWVIGDYMRSRRRFFTDLVEQHHQDRELAAEEERLRIARELHDVVAHNVSVMAIQAGAARVSGSSSTEALESIEQGARDTLAELNKLLGVLRKSPGAPLEPQPMLGEVANLLRPVRDAGVDATLKFTGDKRPLPAALELSAYRIIQEAITNVLKHANASRLEVIVDYEPNALLLTIGDNGSGPREAVGASTGHGLIGMRERVAVFGGDVSTGTSSLGGFTVRAKLPLSP